MVVKTLDGISSEIIKTKRLQSRVLFTKKRVGNPVLFIHGNVSSATFWEETMLQLPENYWGMAPDLRGYGDSDPSKLIDATKGCGDWVEDIIALLDHLKIKKVHVCAHSLGGNIAWSLLGSHADRIKSLVQVGPGSPFGFGSTKDEKGTPTYDDFACSGVSSSNAEFVKLLKAGDRSESNPLASPRVIMNVLLWKPPFRPAREEDLLTSLLSVHVGEKQYPGDISSSKNWTNEAPGKWGPNNALSPKYSSNVVKNLLNAKIKPNILWLRGANDQIVSDISLSDVATKGKLGVIPGWPGEKICPPQPMIRQIRYVLEEYKKHGGMYREIVIEGTGHTPYIEKPSEFNIHFHTFLKENP